MTIRLNPSNLGQTRSDLGLGTAAVADTGTGNGDIPVLDGTGYPAINGSQITTLTSANLTGALPAVSGAALTSLTSANLTGALPAISGAAVTNLNAAALATNTVPTARLGSGTASGTVFLAGDSTWKEAGGGGYVSSQVFTSTGTWTKPSGIKLIRVQLVASGGGGRNWGPGCGAGGYSEKTIDVTSISSVSVTVGAAPTGQTAGNASSFGSHCSATGGAVPSGTGNGGLGGIGTGGDINIQGGGADGGPANDAPYRSYMGGVSYFGGGGAGTADNPGSPVNATNGAFGAGGGGSHNGYSAMPNPRSGIVIVWEYK